MAKRKLTPEELSRLEEILRRFARDPNLLTADDIDFVDHLLALEAAGEIDLDPLGKAELLRIVHPVVEPEELAKMLGEFVALGLIPVWWVRLARLPVIGGVISWLTSVMTAVFQKWGVRVVTNWAGTLSTGAISWLFEQAPTLSKILGTTIAKGARSAPAFWTSIVAQVVSDLTGRAIPPDAIRRAVGPEGTFEAAIPLARYIYNEFTEFIAPTEKITPEIGRDNAIRYLSANLTLNMTAWYLGLVHEMFSLGVSRSLKDLPAQISWAMGLGWLSWLVFGVPFRASISDPLEVYYNRTYQFARPTPVQWIALRRARLIDDETYLQAMADHGFSYEKANWLLEEAWTNPSLSQLETWWERGVVDEEFVYDRARVLGFRDEDIVRIITSMKAGRYQDELRGLVAAAERAFSDGRISKSDLVQLWDYAGLDPTEQGIRALRLDLEGANARRLTASQVLDAFRDGAIDERETRERLRTMGYPDADIDLLMRREVRKLSPAQIVDGYIRALISREEAIERLQGQGYSYEDASTLLSLREARLSEGQILDAMARELISVQDARGRLRELGFRDEDIDLLVALRLKRLSPDEITLAVRSGLMDREEALHRLGELGYPREEALLVLALPARGLRPADILEALRRGFLTESEARARLQALGFVEADVNLLLSLRFRLLSTGDVLDAFLEGLIGFDETLTRLMALGYSQDDAEILIATSGRRSR